MKYFRAPLQIDCDVALHRMLAGSKLIRTHGKSPEFSVVPGGPVSDITAGKILEHDLCKIEDVGLLTDTVQSWKFEVSNS